ncbi:hypothetical protein CsatB_025464 [Cannabis sativa]|uniref:S-protein homolog 5-like n=1 Tax=Cannabis sativa TaxID=3483 RepID=UPI0029CA999B|nr:S-protein homolog 5-like [Cannabis sativa]
MSSILSLSSVITICVMVTLFSCACGVTDIPRPPRQPEMGIEVVVIRNILDGKEQLSVHCKSKDDDLGVQLLTYNSTFTFKFTRNFWGTTLFFCGFQWKDQFHRFDIYTPDGPRCTPEPCLWYIIPSGPCKLEAKTYSYRCYEWGPSSLGSQFEFFPSETTTSTFIHG